MTVPTITNPLGIDNGIANVQSYLQSYLWTTNTYLAYARAYIVDGKPKVFQGGIDYEDLLLDDKVDAHSFFVLPDEVRNEIALEEYSANLDIIFIVNLEKCYSSILHRADENAISDIWALLSPETKGYTINSITTGATVFNGLEGFEVKHDKQPWCCIRFNGEIKYQYFNNEC